jgi:hypothetical protein
MQCEQSRYGQLPDLYRAGRHRGSKRVDGREHERAGRNIDDAIQWGSAPERIYGPVFGLFWGDLFRE